MVLQFRRMMWVDILRLVGQAGPTVISALSPVVNSVIVSPNTSILKGSIPFHLTEQITVIIV